MTHIMRLVGALAVTGLLAMPAWACDHGGKTTDGSQHSHQALVSDYIAPTLTAAPTVEPVRLFVRRGLVVGQPFVVERYDGGPRPFVGGYGYYGGYYGRQPWVGYYRPFYRGGSVEVGPVGVYW